MAEPDWAAIVLAGGAGSRLGGGDKPLRPVTGVPMLTRVLVAVAGAERRIVVGPGSLRPAVPPDVDLISEQPPGGGPVAGLAAGLRLVPPDLPQVAVLAADLPFLTPEPVDLLRLAARGGDGAVFVDQDGRRQLLCGVWHAAALRKRLDEIGDPAGWALRRLVDGLRIREVGWPAVATPPWFDCDTEADLRRAQQPG